MEKLLPPHCSVGHGFIVLVCFGWAELSEMVLQSPEHDRQGLTFGKPNP